MHPYRYRPQPSKRTAFANKQIQRQKDTRLPDTASPKDTPGLDTTAIFLLASCMQPCLQEDVQRLYPYLQPQAQAVVSAAITIRVNSAQLMESARIRAALARHEEHEHPDSHAFLDALTKTNIANSHGLKGPLNHASNTMENVNRMQKTLSQIQREGPNAFLSKHIESGFGQNLPGLGPLFGALMRTRDDPHTGGDPVQQGSHDNPMSMLMQGGSNPLLSMLLQGDAKQALISVPKQQSERSQPSSMPDDLKARP